MCFQNVEDENSVFESRFLKVITKTPLKLLCEVCNITLTGSAPAKQHIDSTKHKKKAEESNMVNIGFIHYFCYVLNFKIFFHKDL